MAVLLLFLVSCNNPKQIEISGFELFTNFPVEGDTLTLEMDLTDGPFGQIAIPSQNGKNGPQQFHFSFSVKAPGITEVIAYKIYYQNVSYKHPETNGGRGYNEHSSENFYGSWISKSHIGFKEITATVDGELTEIKDSVFISGNPFNDPKFFGAPVKPLSISEADIQNQVDQIRSSAEWLQAITDKAEKSNVSVQKQMEDDALWILRNQKPEGNENHRWKNNPRVGTYRFMVVAGTESAIEALPDYILDPNQVHEKYGVRMNPFYYFKFGDGAGHEKIAVAESEQYLKTFAVLRPGEGFYYEPLDFSNRLSESDTSGCTSDSTAFYRAHFQQYLNTEYKDTPLRNVGYTADIGGTSFSREDFQKGRQNASRIEDSYVTKPNTPCRNASYNAEMDAVVLSNPGNENQPYLKENAGTEGRIGFAYGKFRARIQFPQTLSNDNVWNGITCAYWLKFHSLDDWNMRNNCREEGYLSHNKESKEDYRRARPYSEIDIEIVKVSRNWPPSSYEKPDTVAVYDPAEDHNLIVTCTNWDLACQDPDDFHIGIRPIQHKNKTFFTHRWDHWYPALTLKTERPAEQTVGSAILYEIDWSPNEIIWRIGENISTMTEVGYMNSEVTKIPNNQMVPVISQEFHYGEWWPTTPFPQGDLPYPRQPIEGYVYEIVIE